MSAERNSGSLDLSVIIPSYNASRWLPTTVDAFAKALARTGLRAELIVVDDGSTDDTPDVVRQLDDVHPFPVRRVGQENQGVFVAVWTGLKAAAAERLLILNSRLLLDADSLAFVVERLPAEREIETWNGHVETDRAAPLVGRFWEVPTHVFWGSYLGEPRTTLITPENFDQVPKGTGCLIVSRSMLERAYRASWPATGERFTSDDTKLLRFIAAERPIRLEPGFSAVYRPRTTLRKFLAHARNRGTLFVDSYAGTSAVRRTVLVALVVVPPIALVALILLAIAGSWALFWIVTAAGVFSLALPAAIAAARRCAPRAVLSYLAFILPFGVVFWAGLARGLWIHRAAFRARGRGTDSAVERRQRAS